MSAPLSTRLATFLRTRTDANIAELVLCTRRAPYQPVELDAGSIPIGFELSEMNRIASEMAETGIVQKPFRRHVINTYVEDMVLNLNRQDDVSTVRTRDMVRWNNDEDWLWVLYKNTMLPLHVFPSKRNVDCYADIKRTTFKISSTCFLNFDSAYYEDDNSVHNQVYININDLGNLSDEAIGTIAAIMEKMTTIKMAPTS
jgi:hypothetical protein